MKPFALQAVWKVRLLLFVSDGVRLAPEEREVMWNQTEDLVAECQLVLAHGSTTLVNHQILLSLE